MMDLKFQELAFCKGFAVRGSHSAGQYLLIDNTSGLPALNLDRLWFSVKDAVALLSSLPDRPVKH